MKSEYFQNSISIKPTPWDQKIFRFETYEIIVSSEKLLPLAIEQVTKEGKPGHYTIKVDPLWNSKILFDHRFYYCDTLIQPYCSRQSFIFHNHSQVKLSKNNSLSDLTDICNSAFSYGRFHRDFNIDKSQADLRYSSWLAQLFTEGKVWGLMYANDLAGFWGFSGEAILLHALKNSYRGKGIAKYFWSCACQEMFRMGLQEVTSSISSANLAILNLYKSLGFKFQNPKDVYHLLIA